MRDGGVSLGPLALLLAVVSICVETLAILSIATASADMRIAERHADMVKLRYGLETEGSIFLKEADEALRLGMGLDTLPDAHTDDEGITRKEIWKGDYRLNAGVRVDENGNLKVVCWQIGKIWENRTDMGDLWNGDR